MEQLLLVLLGTLVGAYLAFPLVRYQHTLELTRDQKRIAVKLAALAVRIRREIYYQFIMVANGHWIPEAVSRQDDIVKQLDAVLSSMEPLAGEMYVAVLAARESLAANITEISTWFQGEPVNDPNLAIGDQTTSQMDLVAAAELIDRAVNSIPDAHARAAGMQLAERISRLRTSAREGAGDKDN